MKAIVIAGSSLRLEPYAFPYIEQFIHQGFDTTVFVWIRDGQADIKPNNNARVIYYKELLDDATPKQKKIGAFLRFRSALLKEMRAGEYDFVVVLDTQFAVLISDVLLRKYRDHFIFDMRDPSYEQFSLYRKRVAQIVDAAAAVFISSDGYRSHLPRSSKIFTTHNYRKEDIAKKGIGRKDNPLTHYPIRISFWGCIRDREINEVLIAALANDNRFILHYFGSVNDDSKKLIDFCEENSINNVIFGGAYQPEERYSFALNTDLILNVYSNVYAGSNPCVGNKFYDGIIFQIPQMCLAGGYMGKMVEQYKLGFAISFDRSSIADQIIGYFSSFDLQLFTDECEKWLAEITMEYNETSRIMQDIIFTAMKESRRKVYSDRKTK